MENVREIIRRISEWTYNNFFNIKNTFTFRRQPFDHVVSKTKKRKKRVCSESNLSELLDHIDATFNILKLPTDNTSWLHKDSIIGLKRLGVHVPNPWVMWWTDNEEHLKIDISKKMPTVMCISLTDSDNVIRSMKSGEDDKISADICFAIKHKRLPWNVSQLKGTPYQFGLTYCFSKKIFWMHGYLVIDKKGKIEVCDELTSVPHSIKGIGTFYTKKWQGASIVSPDQIDIEKNKIVVKNIFIAMFNWWGDRDLRWSVSVKNKKKSKVTFGVEQQNTKTYFAGRDKTVKAADGKAKRIIHHVREHERVTDTGVTTVKEHIRGIREFDWKGYHCVITAPKFHLSKLSSSFDASGMDEDDLQGRTVGLASVGRILADHEEQDLRRSA